MITELDKNTALVLIDLQKSIVSLTLAHPVKDVLERASGLVAAFREAQRPIVIVNVNPSGSLASKVRKDARQPVASFKEDWLEITPEIQTRETDIFITKRTWNAFFETDLHQVLQSRNITGIVLAGISASIGVEGTARAANELRYNISFATDAMTDMQIDAYQTSLKYIYPRLGETGTANEIISKLNTL